MGTLLKTAVFCTFLFSLYTEASRGPQTAEERLWESRGLTEVSILNFTTEEIGQVLPSSSWTHKFDLHFVLLKNSSWNIAQVIGHLRQVVLTFAQCKVKVDRVKIVSAFAPGAHVIADYGSHGIDLMMAKSVPSSHRPLLFLVEGTDEFYPFKRPDRPSANASYAYYARTDFKDERLNTAWISSYVNKKPPMRFSSHYNSVAHELGHLLLNFGHVEEREPNLMSAYVDWGDMHLTKAQCEELYASPMITAL